MGWGYRPYSIPLEGISMTPQEIEKDAERAVMVWDAIGFSNTRDGLKCLTDNFARLLRAVHDAAIEEEREECAREANREWDQWGFKSEGKKAAGNIAIRIRSRALKTGDEK